METMSLATVEEIVKANLITDHNDFIGSPRPVLDASPTKVNLGPKPAMPKIGRVGTRPKFNKADFFSEKNLFIGDSSYDHAKIQRLSFRTAHQVIFYASLLFDKNKVFMHHDISHLHMESINCFTPELMVLHDVGLLAFCSDVCDWNEK